MARANQEARALVATLFRLGERREPRTAEANYPRTRLPSNRLVGDDGTHATSMIVEYADHDVTFQEEYLA